ncbi:MAG TPA: dihydropteroate synthase [Methanotrichaceae archaeon]|nr:dihydropteroate synthase [Methanotrichaceae archaeon]HQI90464.1 dihydropteroate synthase [Methanotrichaceae archaeon]
MAVEGSFGILRLGDIHPVRMMGVINLSEESFYKGSVATPDRLLALACRMGEEGADLLDVGAVSTAPGSPAISEDTERKRLFPALVRLIDDTDLPVSVDTQRASIAKEALAAGAAGINDVSCLSDPEMAGAVADAGGSLIIMASGQRPGDLLEMGEIVSRLGQKIEEAEMAGVDRHRISVDPGIGRWTEEKSHLHDLAILSGLCRLRSLNRPVVAAVSRKSFIGHVLGLADPADRLAGSVAAAALAVYNGSHIVRTHDVGPTVHAVRMAEAVRGVPATSGKGDIEVELLARAGHPNDSMQTLRRYGAGSDAADILGAKMAFRVLLIQGITPMEALVIKQEMLARGGDAAVPRSALRCDPSADRALIFGSVAHMAGLIRKLKRQPFRLPSVAEKIEAALSRDDDVRRFCLEREA